MIKFLRKTLLTASLLIIGVFLFSNITQAAGEMTITGFDLKPSVVATNTGSTQFQMTFRATMDVAKFNERCGSNANFAWYVYQDVTGFDIMRGSGEVAVNRIGTTLNFNFDQPITIVTRDDQNPNSVGTVYEGDIFYYGQVNCIGYSSWQIARSAPSVKVTFVSDTNRSYACVAADNKYACSKLNLSNCSDASACTGKPCIQIGVSLCGKDAGSGPGSGTGAVCGNNKCETGETQSGCPADCKPGTPGQTQTYPFEITNPLKGGATDFTSLVKILAQWIFNLAIPIAVAMIVYAGILFLTSQGDMSKITKARETLKYAVIGLAIILIGSGFVTLIQSILDLGSGNITAPGAPAPGAPTNPGTNPVLGVIGNKCSADRDCITGLKCQDSICKRPTGNWATEPCNSARNCDLGLTCDKSDSGLQPIDGQNLGTCSPDSSISGGQIGDVCQRDSNCISGLKCNQICQRRDGNLIGEPCVNTAPGGNCNSQACSTFGSNVVGTCVAKP